MTNQELKRDKTLENVIGILGLLSILFFGVIVATIHHLSVNDVQKQLAATWNLESTITPSTKPRDISTTIKNGIPNFWILSPCDGIGSNNLAIDPCDIKPALLTLVRQYDPNIPLGPDNAQDIKRILETTNLLFVR